MEAASLNDEEYDFYITSDDTRWEKEVIIELQKRREGIRCISRHDWILGKYKLDNLLEPVNKCKKVVVGYTCTSSTGNSELVATTVIQQMVDNNTLNRGKLIPVKITENAIIPDSLKVLTSANGWDDDIYEKLLNALDGENIKVKVIQKQPGVGSGDQNDNVVRHLKKCCEYVKENVKMKDVPEVMEMTKEFYAFFVNMGLQIQGIRDGSIIFHLSVYDPKALMNLWEIHLSGKLIKDLAKIMMPEDLQEEFLDKWKTDIDEDEYKSALDKLNKQGRTTSSKKLQPCRVTSKQKKWSPGMAVDEPLSSPERLESESSQPPWAVEVDTSTSIPVGDFHKRVPELAHEWPFELDAFQKQAILHLENKQSVFVAAHTSAGKTVVAEYAIALSLKHGTKAIYTSPIKALSNQKYRDFKELFGVEHVGLQTGDVHLNKGASCVVMTTEILRSQLYDPEGLHDLEWVIIDEVHYISDKTRGVVWEEVLIMLPNTVNLVLLSATFSNTMEFASWVGKTKKKLIYVISTAKRPVPLQHYIYTGTAEITENQLFSTVDVTGVFINENFERALKTVEENIIQTQVVLPIVKPKNQYLSFVKMLEQQSYLPAIVFTFKRKKCKENAASLQSSDLTDRKEKSRIEVFLRKSLKNLTESNRKLSQITELSELLKKGIAYHHSGVLPRMKEIVEHLFQEGLVKVLFATETFASGVNMPARTVIFDSIKKFDGEKLRNLNPGEYIQMAGRAGRRGKDDRGSSIILCGDDTPEISVLRSLQQGKPCPVESQFHLKDNMILNLAKRAKLQMQDVLKQSFAEYTRDSTEKELAALQHQLKSTEPVPCRMCKEDLEEYYDMCKSLHSLRSDLQSESILFPDALPTGRVVIVNSEKHNNVLGIIITKVTSDKFKTVVIYDTETAKSAPKTSSKLKVPMILKTQLYLPRSDFSHCCDVVELEADDFAITTTCIPVDVKTSEQLAQSRVVPSSLFTKQARKMLHHLATKDSDDIPLFIPLIDPENLELGSKFKEREHLEKSVIRFQCLECKHLQKHYELHEKLQELKKKIYEVEEKLSERGLLLLPQFEKRQKMLKSLNYFNDNMEIQQKGLVACEFSHHEVILSELIFRNELDDLDPEEIAAVLSCLVFHGKEPSELEFTETIRKVIEKIKSIAEELASRQLEYGIKIDIDVDEFKLGFADVVYEWARGKSFEEIRLLAGDIPEGAIVSTMQQLIYTCREISSACGIIGKSVLASKVNVASLMLKRDIIDLQSLYTE